ncbi:MAG: glycosyltransferase [Saprospiraceae bacterium]|nr:glycosyltransferase [Saprospiraceae bacterium]
MTKPPDITVLVPVFNGELFVAQTLKSIQDQSKSNIRIHISDDASRDNSASVCQNFLNDDRFELFLQKKRLGWVRNINGLLKTVQTPFFCIIPHDDIIVDSYLEKLFRTIRENREIAIAFSDLREFQDSQRAFSEPSLLGDRFHRCMDFLVNHSLSLPFRGLMRTSMIHAMIPTNAFPGPGSDFFWLLKIVQEGAFIRIPETLYFKRRHADNQVYGWREASCIKVVAGLIYYYYLLNRFIKPEVNDVARKKIRKRACVSHYLTKLKRVASQRGSRRDIRLIQLFIYKIVRNIDHEPTPPQTEWEQSLSLHLLEQLVDLDLIHRSYETAHTRIDRAMSSSRTESRLRRIKASIFLKENRDLEALHELQVATSLQYNTQGQVLLARALKKLSRFNEAEDLLIACLEKDADSEIAQSELIHLYLQMGKESDALDVLERAVQLNGSNLRLKKLQSKLRESAGQISPGKD